jgi:hypothetical protein
MARIAFNESIGTDRGEAIVGAMVAHLRQNSILLPSAAVLEKIALVGRARARKQAYKELTAGMDHAVRDKLDALIRVADDEARTPLAWLREWPEAPVQKNLAGIVQRLQSVKAIGVEPDRERRIHRARYPAIARETAILSAQHLHRFDYQRRLALWDFMYLCWANPTSWSARAPLRFAPRSASLRCAQDQAMSRYLKENDNGESPTGAKEKTA